MLARTIGSEAVEPVELENEAERALQSRKSVLCLDSSNVHVPKKIWALGQAYPDLVHIHVGDVATSPSFEFSDNAYSRVDVPVILVGGLIEEADTSVVLLRLTARLRADGFWVTAVRRHPIGSLFGLHTLDHILDRKDLAEADKIQELDIFFKNLEMRERPNVILVEAPDALMRHSDFASNGFGIRTYMVCQALRPDFLVCCVPCEMTAEPFLQALSSDFEYRLGCPIHAVHVSNLVVDSIELMQTHSVSYIHADMEEVSEQIAKESTHSSVPLFDVVGSGVEGLYSHLCNIAGLVK